VCVWRVQGLSHNHVAAGRLLWWTHDRAVVGVRPCAGCRLWVQVNEGMANGTVLPPPIPDDPDPPKPLSYYFKPATWRISGSKLVMTGTPWGNPFTVPPLNTSLLEVAASQEQCTASLMGRYATSYCASSVEGGRYLILCWRW
jgi:hypothetical protein